MTIIAYKQGVIAADRLVSSGQIICGQGQKIARASDGTLFAAAGQLTDTQRLLHWGAERGASCIDEDRPDIDSEHTVMLIVLNDGRIYEIIHGAAALRPARIIDTIAAHGSGAEIGLGVMEQGGSAVDACVVACRRITNCGAGIDWLAHDGSVGHIEEKVTWTR